MFFSLKSRFDISFSMIIQNFLLFIELNAHFNFNSIKVYHFLYSEMKLEFNYLERALQAFVEVIAY